jgi:hypothetical protein
MMKKLKVLCLAMAMGASTFGFLGSGCFDLERLVRQGAWYAASEFLLDSNTSPLGLDLFPDS